jgi:hypothetical protein
VGAVGRKLSPDGSLLSFICRGGELLCLADADGTNARELVRADDCLVSHSWSPDGTRIAYWELHRHDVFVVDVANGEATYVGEGAYPVWVDDHTLIVEIDRCYDHESGARAEGCSG